MWGCWAQEFIICLYVGHVALAEEESTSEEDESLSIEIVLVNREVVLVIMV